MRKLLIFLLSLPGGSLAAEYADPPLVIAHRGASGYLPEHTLEAKVLAFAQGADYLEQDIVMTRDNQLLVSHDLTLDRTTDVATRFPDRARADGQYYVIDFTLAELRQLQVTAARSASEDGLIPQYPARFPPGVSRFGLHTLGEELELLAGLRHSTGRTVGIYPELKAPWFHHQHGKDLAAAVLQVLREHGYTTRESPVFLQSFDYNELVRVRESLLPQLGIDLKLVQLIADNAWGETFEQDEAGNWRPFDYDWMREPGGPARLARTVDGVGPAMEMLVTTGTAGEPVINPLMDEAHRAGLLVHPYTFRADPGRLPAYARSFDGLLEIFFGQVGVDGIFTDFPDLAVRFLQQAQ